MSRLLRFQHTTTASLRMRQQAAATTATMRCVTSSSSASSNSSSKLQGLRETLLLSRTTNNNIHEDMIWTQNPYDIERHGRGESFHNPPQRPKAVVYPTCVEDVITIVKYCSEHDISIIPFGVGTSVEGHVCCVDDDEQRDCISVDMNQHFQTIEFPSSSGENGSIMDPWAKVGAGVTRQTLNQALRHTGLYFSVDPGADATIGGMVATGASGTTAVRYGTMRDQILELECVLADGSFVTTGCKALKNVAGYDLNAVLCGSEGTLGIITSVTVQLHPLPSHVMAAVCVFETLGGAAEAVATLKLSDIPLLRCELLDAPSMVAFQEYSKNNNQNSADEQKPTLFLEFQASSLESLQEQVRTTESILQLDDSFGCLQFQSCSDEKERQALWAARHNLYYAAMQLRPNCCGAIVTDVCVPLSELADCMTATAQDVHDKQVVGPCFGHAGDGNFHCILPMSEDDSEDYLEKLHEVNHNLIQRTLQVGGTCTGEHGVGYGKIKYLEQQYGPGAVNMMKTMKRALDPKNIMNPGKVVIV